MANTTPEPKLGTEQLTFGAELEFVFAFHESQLTLGKNRHRSDGKDDEVVKNIPFDERARLFTNVEVPGHVYNSWGIRRFDEADNFEDHPYSTEPMEIVGKILGKNGIHADVHDAMDITDKTSDKYREWIITKDVSVCGVGSSNIPKWLEPEGYRLSSEAAGDWDSFGIEAVSPVFNTAARDVADAGISGVIGGVKGTAADPYGAFITNQ